MGKEGAGNKKVLSLKKFETILENVQQGFVKTFKINLKIFYNIFKRFGKFD